MNNAEHEEVKVLASILFKDTGTLMVPTEITSKVVGRSKISLDRDRAEGVGIPCSKLGKRKGSDRVLYNIYDIAKFIVSRKMKVL